MPSIGSHDVGFPVWPDVGTLEHLLELLDVINNALNIHLEQYNGAGTGAIDLATVCSSSGFNYLTSDKPRVPRNTSIPLADMHGFT